MCQFTQEQWSCTFYEKTKTLILRQDSLQPFHFHSLAIGSPLPPIDPSPWLNQVPPSLLLDWVFQLHFQFLSHSVLLLNYKYIPRGTIFSKEFVAAKEDAQFYIGSILANICRLFKWFYVFSGGPFSPIGETFYLLKNLTFTMMARRARRTTRLKGSHSLCTSCRQWQVSDGLVLSMVPWVGYIYTWKFSCISWVTEWSSK